MGFIFYKIKWWQVLLVGVITSFGIEFLQFVLKCGLAEFDDVFHNALGCMLGYGISVGIVYVNERVRMNTLNLGKG